MNDSSQNDNNSKNVSPSYPPSGYASISGLALVFVAGFLLLSIVLATAIYQLVSRGFIWRSTEAEISQVNQLWPSRPPSRSATATGTRIAGVTSRSSLSGGVVRRNSSRISMTGTGSHSHSPSAQGSSDSNSSNNRGSSSGCYSNNALTATSISGGQMAQSNSNSNSLSVSPSPSTALTKVEN